MEVASSAILNSGKNYWDPREVLGIEPLSPDFTCIGKEVTKGGSACISRLDKTVCNAAEDLLNEITETNVAERSMNHQLQRLASLVLCQDHHQYQAAEKAREWVVKIREHGQELKENAVEVSSSDIQAMNTELGQMKTQLALIAIKYSNLREKHAAVVYENETLRQNQIRLKEQYDSTIYKLEQESREREKHIADALYMAKQSQTSGLIDSINQPYLLPFVQKGEKSDLGDENFATLKPGLFNDEMPTVSSYPSAGSSEESKHPPISQYSIKDLQILLQEIVSIFADDKELKPLCLQALRDPSIGVTRFKDNFRRFLVNFANNLGTEAQEAYEKNVALMVQVCADDLATGISSQFSDEDDDDDNDDSDRVLREELDRADSVKLLMLSHYLMSNEARETRNPLVSKDNPDLGYLSKDTHLAIEFDRCQGSDFDNSSSGFSDVLFLSLRNVKKFMVESEAFELLRRQLYRFVIVDHLVLVDSFTHTISYAVDKNRVVKFTPWTMTTEPGFSDRIKGTLAKWIGSPVIWWPLQAPRSRCPNGYMRISWACACGADLSVDVSVEAARDYKKKCSSTSNNRSILPLHNNTTPIAMPTGISSQTQTMAPFSSGLSQRSSLQSASTSNQNGAAATKSSPQSDRYVHWCVDANRYETELNHISVPTLDDSSFISKLKSAYRTTRGIRQWFSLTDCYGVRFVAFERINRSRDLVACGQEELPCSITDRDYVYFYRDPREQFIKTLEQSLIHSFHNPRSCTAQNMEDIIRRIPKKTNGRLRKEYGVLGYGMHAVPGWAVWKLMVALLLSQLGPSVFVIKWLCGHSGDLQNAFSLSMYLIALLNLVVVIPDVWSLQK